MPSTQARKAFAEFLVRQREGGTPSIEEFAARHPEVAGELLRLYASRRDETRVDSFFKRLRDQVGTDVDPGISLESEPTEEVTQDTASLLDKVAAMSKGRRYSIKGELARGGMGMIYKVWDLDLRRTLAMKVVLGKDGAKEGSSAGVDRDRLSRFLEEAQITGQLDHPGIVPVHELGLDSEGRVYFTMRLVRGVELRDIIDEYHRGVGERTLTRTLQIILRICEAMAFAHENGVVHRDLKPANVMVGRFGEVYVMDWGLAKIVGREDHRASESKPDLTRSMVVGSDRAAEEGMETMEGSVFGTPCYMAPEQARGHRDQIGPWSDVYSVGSILYHLLTGRMPFVSEGDRMHPHAVLALLLQGPPVPIRECDASVPDELIAICEKAMRREPARRYASMGQMGEDLQAYLEGRVVQAHSTGAVTEFKKWVLRNKGTAISTAGLILVLVAGSIGFALQQSRLVATIRARQAETIAAKDAAEYNEREASRRSYVANLIAADVSVRSGEIQEAKRRLAACDEELRGWEWRHVAIQADASVAVLEHGDEVRCVAADGDFFRVATGSSDFAIRIWDPASGQLVSTLSGHSGAVTSLAFSPDGRQLASASEDGSVRLWDVASERPVLAMREHESAVACLAFSPDGAHLASGGWDGTLRFWNADTGREELVVPVGEQPLSSVAYAPDGATVATGSDDGGVQTWNLDGTPAVPFGGHLAEVTAIEFSPDGTLLASVSTDGKIAVWNVGTGAAELELEGGDPVFCLAFLPDGERIVTGSLDKSLRMIRVATGETEAMLAGHDQPVRSIDVSADGSRLVSGSADRTARLWAIEIGGAATVLPIGADYVGAVAFAPDGRRMAAGALFPGDVRIWDAPSGRLLREIPGREDSVNGLAFSPDGEWIAVGLDDSAVVLVLDSHTGDERLPPLTGHEASVSAVAVSPDGGRIASASADPSVRLWDSRTGSALKVLTGHEEPATSVAFDPDGKRVAAGAMDGVVLVWDVQSGAEPRSLETGGGAVHAVLFSPDGTALVTASQDGVVRVWDASSWELLPELAGHEGPVKSLSFGPKGQRLASGSFDKTVLLWDFASRDALLSLRGHTRPVVQVAFSPDGERILSGSLDGDVIVWETLGAAGRFLARKAADLVEARRAEMGSLAEVTASIEGDGELGEALRREALAYLAIQ